ncbi:MAG: plasmid mobilization protein [Solirubrobacteraceae bacterium]
MSATETGRPLGRARRAPRANRRRVSQQVMLSEDERQRLRERAAELSVSVPRLLVESALAGVETPSERREMIAELFEVRRLLATVANNVNQLAKAANISGEIGSRERLEATLAGVDGVLVALRGWTGARR